MPPFFQFSVDGLLVEACYRYSFGTLREHQPFPAKKVYKNISFHHVMWICQSCFLITPCGFVKLWLCHSIWLFGFSNILKICAFSPNFPLVGSVVGGFYWLFLWNFKEIKHQPFSMTQPKLFKRAIGQKRNWLWKRKRCPSSRIQCRFIWWRECHSKMITVFRFERAQYDCISFS